VARLVAVPSLEAVMREKPLVLCPVDFSESCCGALRYAAAIAEHFQSELLIVTVDDPLLNDAVTMTVGPGHLAKETARALERFYQGTFVDRPLPVARPRFEVAVGTPSVEILALARRKHADIIVMSSRGASGVRKMFFGATTERVLRETTVPVLVTPATGVGPGRLEDIRKTVRRVLAPVDRSDASPRQVRVAQGIAEALDVPLLLLHVVEPVRANRTGHRLVPGIDGERRDRAERDLESLAAALPGSRKVESLVVFGDPPEEIAKVTQDRDEGLIVMGLHASPLKGQRMGSVTYRVLCLAHTPVLALPPLKKTNATAPADRRDVGIGAGQPVA
jgi:nucleotide-binding universal stress UspA family protein